MAGHNIVLFNFNPMKFKELMEPLTEYNKIAKEDADRLEAMLEITGPFDTQLSEADGDVYRLSQQYNKELNDFAWQLPAFGYSLTNGRARALALRSKFNRYMKPIYDSYTKRNKEAAQLIDANIKAGGSLVSDYDPMSIPLDTYFKNPSFSALTRVTDGKEVMNEAYKIASALAGRISNPGEKLKYIDLFHYRLKTSYGYDPKIVAYAIAHPNDPTVFKAIIDSVVAPYGGWSPQSLNALRQWAAKGLWGAVGKETVETITDEGRKARYTAALNRSSSDNNKLKLPKATPNYGQRNPLTEREIGFLKLWKDFRKYFYRDKDGYYKMNEAGKKEYEAGTPKVYSKYTSGLSAGMNTSSGISPEGAFTKFINSNGLQGMAKDNLGSWSNSRITNLEKKYLEDTDLTLYTEKSVNIGRDMYPDVIDKLNLVSKDGSLTPRELTTDKNGKYILSETSDKLKVNELAPEKIRGMEIFFGTHSPSYLEISLDNGNKARVPYSVIDPAKDALVKTQMAKVANGEKYRDAGYGSLPVDIDGTLVYLPTLDALTYLTNAAGNNLLTSFGTSKASDRNVELDLYGVDIIAEDYDKYMSNGKKK